MGGLGLITRGLVGGSGSGSGATTVRETGLFTVQLLGFAVDTQHVDWSAAGLERSGYKAPRPGDDWIMRVKIVDGSGLAPDLTSAFFMLTAKPSLNATVSVTRRSDTTITGSSPARSQIVFDSDQTTESVDAYGRPTGRGCMAIRFGHEAADHNALLAVLGKNTFDLRGRLVAAGDTTTYLRGVLEVLAAVTEPMP